MKDIKIDKRNIKVKDNVDDMIFQVLDYIDHSNLPDDEAETLVFEILSSIILWDCDWDPENIDMKSVIKQINDILLTLSIIIPKNLDKCVKQYGYRVTGE